MNKETAFHSELYALPFLGEMSLGQCLNKHEVIDYIKIPAYLLPSLPSSHNILPEDKTPSERYFAIKMTGDSMQASGILHNDLLIIHKSSTAQNNHIVFATIDNLETVIKHFEQTNDLIILSNRNPDVKPMIFDPSRIKIVGTLVATMRCY